MGLEIGALCWNFSKIFANFAILLWTRQQRTTQAKPDYMHDF